MCVLKADKALRRCERGRMSTKGEKYSHHGVLMDLQPPLGVHNSSCTLTTGSLCLCLPVSGCLHSAGSISLQDVVEAVSTSRHCLWANICKTSPMPVSGLYFINTNNSPQQGEVHSRHTMRWRYASSSRACSSLNARSSASRASFSSRCLDTSFV